jgi:hypothetical protein
MQPRTCHLYQCTFAAGQLAVGLNALLLLAVLLLLLLLHCCTAAAYPDACCIMLISAVFRCCFVLSWCYFAIS